MKVANGKPTFSTISTNQEWCSNDFFDVFSVFFFDNTSSDTIRVLFKADELSAQLDECPIFLDMSPEYFFAMVLSEYNTIRLFEDIRYVQLGYQR